MMLTIKAIGSSGQFLVRIGVGSHCHIYGSPCTQAHRSSGIRFALPRRRGRTARARGATRTDAMVLDDNVLGHTIWHRAGYKRQREWSRWVKPVDP